MHTQNASNEQCQLQTLYTRSMWPRAGAEREIESDQKCRNVRVTKSHAILLIVYIVTEDKIYFSNFDCTLISMHAYLRKRGRAY